MRNEARFRGAILMRMTNDGNVFRLVRNAAGLQYLSAQRDVL